MDEEQTIKPEEKVEIHPVPYKSVHQTCKVCGSPLKEGESVVCRNCIQKNN